MHNSAARAWRLRNVRAIVATASMLRQPSGTRVLLRVVAGVIAFGIGCGESTAPPAPVASVVLSPEIVDLVPGGTSILQASPKDASGNPLTDRIATWSTSDASTVTVAAGVLTGVAVGTATITATIEGHSASKDVTVKDGAVVSSSGASFSAQSSAVTVVVPPGAITQTRNITVGQAQSAPSNDRLMPGTAFDFGPNGITFAEPVTITIKYDPSKLTGGSPEEGLQLYEVVGTGWQVVAGSSANTTSHTVSGKVSHFTVYGVLMQPRVETVTINRDTTVQVRSTVQFSATLKDNEQQVLTRPVTWSSSNPAIVTIDASGRATALIPGQSTITAASEGKTATATLTVTPGAAASLAIVAGDGQVAVAGSPVATLPAVRVTDSFDNAVSGFAITFSVASGGGTVTAGTTTTNSAGIAAVGSWTLGTTAGPNTLTATGAGLTPASVTFTSTGLPGAPATASAFAGNNQTATAGAIVTTPPAVKVTDANGNPVSGFTVQFATGAGSGAVTGGTAVTNSLGIAAVLGWTLGITPGVQTLVATAGALTGSPVVFSATAVAPVPARVILVEGDGQTAGVGKAVAVMPTVRVVDAAGIGVPGFAVAFSVTAGGGSLTGGEAITNENGFASVGSWVLGANPGQNTIIATAGSLAGSPVIFNATGVAPSAVAMAIVAGNQQTAAAGAQVPIKPAVIVTDVEGRGVPGFAITFAVTGGGGTVTTGETTTDASGIATVGSWTLGKTVGPNTLTANAAGLTPASLTFEATGVAGAPATVVAVSGIRQSATAGKPVATPPAVKVTDANGNPVSGFTVDFGVGAASGTVTGGTAITDEAGIGAVVSWVLGPIPGAQTLVATAGSLTGSPVVFSATAVAPVPSRVVPVEGDGQTAGVGKAVAVIPTVRVVDDAGIGVPGFAVAFSVTAGGGSLTGGEAITNENGFASVGSWVLGANPGQNTIIATAGSLAGSPVIFNATGVAPSAVAMAIVAGNQQTAAAGAQVPIKPAVIVTDVEGRGVPGFAITFAVTGGGGTVTTGETTTDASGIATVGSWTLGKTVGPNTLTANAAGLTPASLTFEATGVAGAPATVVAVSGIRQSATAGKPVATPPAVKVTDANGNPVSGFTVDFGVGAASGTVTGGTAITDEAGIGAVVSWVLGPIPGAQTLVATAGTLNGSPVTFSATAIAAVPARVVYVSGDGQSAGVGKPVPAVPVVRVVDADGIGVAGFAVVFTVTAGGGSVTGAEVVTDKDGLAAVGSWVLGPNAGQNTLVATAGSLVGSPVTFNATGVAPTPVAMAIFAGDQQTATSGSQVPIRPAVIVTDAQGRGVPGVNVVFSIRSGAGSSITGADTFTNTSGVATLGSWTLGIGENSLFATSPGLAGNPLIFTAFGTVAIQLVTFGDSNTDLGFSGSDPVQRVSSYVSNAQTNGTRVRLGPNDPNSSLQLAGKIESKWRATRSQSIRVVNHAISGTSTGAGRDAGSGAPNALEVVGGVTRFQGEALGMAYPWSGGEPVNDAFPSGPVLRIKAFQPRNTDFLYISMGTNDVGGGVPAATILSNLEVMVDQWIALGRPARHVIITTLPPRPPGTSSTIPALNDQIRSRFGAKGAVVVSIDSFVSNDGGLTWKSSSFHVGDSLHYSESVRDWIADQVVEIMNAFTP